MSACAAPTAFGTKTQQEWCDQLLEANPTASTQDITETKLEVAKVRETIQRFCGK